jgi:hypothetical protein
MTIDLLPVRPKVTPKQTNPPSVVAEPEQVAPPSPPEPKAESAPEPEAAPITLVTDVESHGGPTVPLSTAPFREATDDSGSTVIMPSPLMAAAVTTEDQKLHEDAKRFARLLVSEIKLYNEAQVSAGRENKDLYDRLKDDIERSRRMYLERVPEHIHSTTNYFYEELVRTLANGDPVLLGM